MNHEWYNEAYWYKQHRWDIKPHSNCMEDMYCKHCGLPIQKYERCFYCTNTLLARLRPFGKSKLCLQCGYDIMELYGPVIKNPIDEQTNMLITGHI